jgi:hydrogenase maturation protein HypF
VQIKVQGTPDGVEGFLDGLRNRPPPLAHIERIETDPSEVEEFTGFRILKSRDGSGSVSRISPDIAVCDECLGDIFDGGRRAYYPFTNCTNCGPRFSIVKALPYDRGSTTMSVFPMCRRCLDEYEDITNRRYHAQPNACPECGPRYELRDKISNSCVLDIEEILQRSAEVLESGGILAVKGVGGFHLACDASNEEAVERLRRGKRREGKPFAVMARSLEKVLQVALVDAEEERLLVSLARPVVLLSKQEAGKGALSVGGGVPAPSVSRGLTTLGIMLPYAPIHHLIFAQTSLDFLVMTSGNVSGEPLQYRNEDALNHLTETADALLLYNREIHNRCDDSVAFTAAGGVRLIRRSRGMVPDPIPLSGSVNGIVAGGGELKNCFAVGRNKEAILSQHIGDLKNYDTLRFYRETLERFLEMFRIEPQSAACDLHPDYESTKVMKSLGIPLIEVQHHHAHIASVLAEHGIEERVIGVGFDGTGYGDDGAVWGGEFFVCDLAGYTRISHFDYLPLPGGDRAAEQPWRMALSYLYRSFPPSEARRLCRQLCATDTGEGNSVQGPNERLVSLVGRAIETETASPPTSSVGRLFDAVSSLLGLVQVSDFEAEAAMRLQSCAAEEASRQGGYGSFDDLYPFRIEETVRTEELIEAIVHDLRRGEGKGRIALKFHRTVAEVVGATVEWIGKEYGLGKVALSGGVFQNRILLELTKRRLEDVGFDVLLNEKVPANDGGIALGQIAVAGALRRNRDRE